MPIILALGRKKKEDEYSPSNVRPPEEAETGGS